MPKYFELRDNVLYGYIKGEWVWWCLATPRNLAELHLAGYDIA